MKKAIKWIVIALVILVVVVVAVVLKNLDEIIRSTVESQGTKQLQVDTKLGAVHLSVLSGGLSISDFSIGSPKGFTAPQMLALGKANVQVSMDGIKGNPKRVGLITLDKPKLVIEQSGLNLNFKALVDQLPKSDTPAQPAPQPAETADQMKLIIDQININGAEVAFKAGIPGLDKELSIPIPDLVLKNLGNADGAQNGIALKDVVVQVITGMVASAANSDLLPAPVKALLKGNLADVASQMGGILKDQVGAEIGKLGEGAGKAAGDILSGKTPSTQSVGDAAGDLLKGFGKKKDK
ncbi:hypothetical protein BH10PLA1_BH10PLA1_05030 [soil metagenome]